MTVAQQDPATLRLVAGRALAAELQPYLGTALFALKPVREERIPTMGVDKQWRVYWNPDFVQTLTPQECAAVWLHEVGHVLREHNKRFEVLLEPLSRHPLFNRAGDAAINFDLREAGINLPRVKAVFPEHIPGATPGMTAEQMYRLLLSTPEADKFTGQVEDLTLLPNAVITGKADGQRIIGMTRAGFLDNDDLTVTVLDLTDNAVPVRDIAAHDRRTLSFVLHAEPEPGPYLVTVTSAGTSVQAVLTVVAPTITLRPDHVASDWAIPYRITIAGQFTNFSPSATATMHDTESGAAVTTTGTEWVSGTYLTFDVTEHAPPGIYTVTVTDGPDTYSAAIPVGLPFMDITPETLPVGHGFPYPFAAVVDDFTFDTSTTIDLYALTPFGIEPITGALSAPTIKTAAAADFTLGMRLDEGQYLIAATTGDQRAVATLTVSAQSGSGDGGDGTGDDQGEGQGNGKAQTGEGDNNGDSEPDYDDCGSGAGGSRREWEHDSDTSDGSVDEGRGNLIREQVARDIQQHAKTRGNIPGGWTRWADSILKPQVDWRKELRSVVRRTLANVAGMRDYTYQRPSRRASSVPNVVLPAMRAPRPPQVACVVDTSGSVSNKMLGQALGDMGALLKQITAAGGDALRIIACDAAAADMVAIRDMKNLTSLDGGGGTDMRVGINAAADLKPRMDLIVTFTDGETPWPTQAPDANPHAKYVAVLLAGDTSASAVPEWMHTIVVNDAYLSGR